MNQKNRFFSISNLAALGYMLYAGFPVQAKKPPPKKPVAKKPARPTKAQIQQKLEQALSDSDAAGVKSALDLGADPNLPDQNGNLPLQMALVGRDWQSANWLRLKGASIQKAGPQALLSAAEVGDAEVLRYLIRLGIKPAGLYDSDGASPLVACAGGMESGSDEEAGVSEAEAQTEEVQRLPALRALLEAGALPNQPDKNGQFALHAAADRGRAALVKLLLDKGARVNTVNKAGYTPLFAATPFPAAAPRYKKVRDLLFAQGADPNIGTPANGLGPFHYAVREGRDDLIQEFLAHKANVNAAMLNGQTPLIIAMREARVTAARLLLENGADVQRKDKNNKTALDYEKYGLGDTEAQKEIDLNNPQTGNPQTGEFFDEAMQGKTDAKFWAGIKKRRVQIATLIRQHLQTTAPPPTAPSSPPPPTAPSSPPPPTAHPLP